MSVLCQSFLQCPSLSADAYLLTGQRCRTLRPFFQVAFSHSYRQSRAGAETQKRCMKELLEDQRLFILLNEDDP